MITSYADWAAKHPEAAADLAALTADLTEPSGQPNGASEAAAQQAIRMSIARMGGLAWRNNVGATPSMTEHVCPKCRFNFQERDRPIRYGLANDSAQMNCGRPSSRRSRASAERLSAPGYGQLSTTPS